MKHFPLALATVLTCTLLPLFAFAADSTHYNFPTDGFSEDLDQSWTPDVQEGALKTWDAEDTTHLEIYAVPSRQAKNLRRYVANHDKDIKTSCDGKPAVKVLSAEWLTINGHRALMRHELSCMTGSDFYVTYITDKKFVAEITTNRPSSVKTNKTVTFVDKDGKHISDMAITDPPHATLTDADVDLHTKILLTFRFQSDVMPHERK